MLPRGATVSATAAEEVFGTSSANDAARKHQQQLKNQREHNKFMLAQLHRLLVEPQSRFRLWWDLISCVLICFIALSLPYRSAFEPDWSLTWTVVRLRAPPDTALIDPD